MPPSYPPHSLRGTSSKPLGEFAGGVVCGAAAGFADTSMTFPAYCWHYRRQLGQQLNPFKNPRIYVNPLEWYRGVGPYLCIVPVTALSSGCMEYLHRAHDVPALAASLAGGAVAGLALQTPASNVVVTQTNRTLGAHAAATALWRGGGGMARFFVGIQPIVAREMVYAAAVFWGEDAVARSAPAAHTTSHGASSAVVAGVVATALSQPLDTLGTFMQRDGERRVRTAVDAMWTEGTWRRFYRGFGYRCVAVIAGVFVMNKARAITKRALKIE